MKMPTRILPLSLLLIIGACTTPADVSRPASTQADENAETKVIPTNVGFDVDVSYSRYQFVPETGALITACRSIALGRAQEEARLQGREIEPIAEQDIRVSTGRNILNARTKCRAYLEARWKT
ncbi:hypothetical protein [Croceicoccus marinus]|uniref:hypothetical protein n=1 Tax=Croceicoccus marinus TaxID=450378 RepID=UPI0012FAB2E1|nr:hypothetical protein [Croceicoccus marinus]